MLYKVTIDIPAVQITTLLLGIVWPGYYLVAVSSTRYCTQQENNNQLSSLK